MTAAKARRMAQKLEQQRPGRMVAPDARSIQIDRAVALLIGIILLLIVILL